MDHDESAQKKKRSNFGLVTASRGLWQHAVITVFDLHTGAWYPEANPLSTKSGEQIESLLSVLPLL